MAIFITPEELKIFNKIHMEDKEEVKEVQNETHVCQNCNKLIYNSERCSCKTKFDQQPKWMQDVISETKEKGKATNGPIG